MLKLNCNIKINFFLPHLSILSKQCGFSYSKIALHYGKLCEIIIFEYYLTFDLPKNKVLIFRLKFASAGEKKMKLCL